jgi:hypothetical protein
MQDNKFNTKDIFDTEGVYISCTTGNPEFPASIWAQAPGHLVFKKYLYNMNMIYISRRKKCHVHGPHNGTQHPALCMYPLAYVQEKIIVTEKRY